MNSFAEKEAKCQLNFNKLGPCYHLWTKEDFEIIFRNEEEFRFGMGIVAIAAKLFPDVKVITFELMSNHLHILAAGVIARIMALFNYIKAALGGMASKVGHHIDWTGFKADTRQLESLNDVRNVLVYDNRNGFLVNPGYTPFSYPWGANSCYFNPDARARYNEGSRASTVRERRLYSRSHNADDIHGLAILDDVCSPFSFCDIEAGEGLFRDASHYFYSLGRSIEQNAAIAKEIGESIFYTDDELFSAISAKCQKEYGTRSPGQICAEAKIEIAKVMRNDFNASSKQIQRILKISPAVLQSLFG